MQIKSDIVIIGTGVAGLFSAIKLAQQLPEKKITVLTKSRLSLSNSNYAQGGIASVTNFGDDSFQNHIQDTLKSGAGLSVEATVKLVVESAPKRIQELIEYGMDFTRDKQGNLDLALEGGHSHPRVVHADDNTGMHLIQTLEKIAKNIPNITILEHRFGIEFLQNKEDRIIGVSTLNLENKQIEYYTGLFVILATGGSGQVYQNTTNPIIATGDGIGMAQEYNAQLSNLGYFQFHPTALFEKDKNQLLLLTEAIRGFGAYIVNHKGERFLFKTDARGELATRDIVSSAIFHEIRENKQECVFLDCRHLNPDGFKSKFPSIYKELVAREIDFTTDLIPVVPAAHYQCGGIKVNEKGQTSLDGLYAIGECSETGLHGANRLASNSLLEGLVFAHETAGYIANDIEEKKIDWSFNESSYDYDDTNDAFFKKITNRIKSIMTQKATIIAKKEDLIEAKNILKEIKEDCKKYWKDNKISEQSLITKNIIANATLIVEYKLNKIVNKKIYNQAG